MSYPRTPYDLGETYTSFNNWRATPPETVGKVRAGYAYGLPIKQISDKFNLDYSTVYRIVTYQTHPDQFRGLKELCLDRSRGSGINKLVEASLYRHYGLKIKSIAQLMNKSERTIYRYLG